MKFFAPAKVNLCLHVIARRPDGYHELCMIMQKISLSDELDIAITSAPCVDFSCPGVDLGASVDNLVVRAAQALLKYDDQRRGLRITLKKNIPVAAGLGGGSSDAATTLVAVNKLLGLDLDTETLHREALLLGADVPFFLYGSTAWATGVGDTLQPVTILPQYWLVLVNPGVAVSTAQVYNALSADSYSSCSMGAVVSNHDELVSLLHNDLESVTLELCPPVVRLKDEMLQFGAAGVLMSGSGPTVFGLFFSLEAAHCAQRAFLKRGHSWSCVVRPIE